MKNILNIEMRLKFHNTSSMCAYKNEFIHVNLDECSRHWRCHWLDWEKTCSTTSVFGWRAWTAGDTDMSTRGITTLWTHDPPDSLWTMRSMVRSVSLMDSIDLSKLSRCSDKNLVINVTTSFSAPSGLSVAEGRATSLTRQLPPHTSTPTVLHQGPSGTTSSLSPSTGSNWPTKGPPSATTRYTECRTLNWTPVVKKLKIN